MARTHRERKENYIHDVEIAFMNLRQLARDLIQENKELRGQNGQLREKLTANNIPFEFSSPAQSSYGGPSSSGFGASPRRHGRLHLFGRGPVAGVVDAHLAPVAAVPAGVLAAVPAGVLAAEHGCAAAGGEPHRPGEHRHGVCWNVRSHPLPLSAAESLISPIAAFFDGHEYGHEIICY